MRRAVFAKYGRRCWRCGNPAGTVGHVVARVLGGTWELENLRPECKRCNYSAGAALGNRLRLRHPLTAAQRQAIARKPAQPGQWPASRDW
jgi:5-methylcytosine-specific restriction endonuclease McrA